MDREAHANRLCNRLFFWQLYSSVKRIHPLPSPILPPLPYATKSLFSLPVFISVVNARTRRASKRHRAQWLSVLSFIFLCIIRIPRLGTRVGIRWEVSRRDSRVGYAEFTECAGRGMNVCSTRVRRSRGCRRVVAEHPTLVGSPAPSRSLTFPGRSKARECFPGSTLSSSFAEKPRRACPSARADGGKESRKGATEKKNGRSARTTQERRSRTLGNGKETHRHASAICNPLSFTPCGYSCELRKINCFTGASLIRVHSI